MLQIPLEEHQKIMGQVKAMQQARAPWISVWREISDYFLPRRYLWLMTDKEVRSASIRNQKLLDSTSIMALRTLSTGMMNGITSPARPWFRLTRPDFAPDTQASYDEAVWLEAAGRIMLYLMAQSNFYNAMGVLYQEWPAFGTASMSIYEDDTDIFRCHNYALGEFFIACDGDGRINGFGREFSLDAGSIVAKFGLDVVSPQVRRDWEAGGARRMTQHAVMHLTKTNDGEVRKSAPWADIYWEKASTGTLLRKSPLDEWPHIVSRWEVYANDFYGTSPCMDALPDVIQLQQMVKRRGQGLDKVVNPPMLVNQSLSGRPRSTLPGGETFVPGGDLDKGARPLYQIQMPFQELGLDIMATKQSIKEVLFNPLFTMISDLSTVRSATEVDARREEKLILLGPTRDRFENEALTPAIQRIFSICRKRGVFGPEPESLQGRELQVHYTSILSDAQRAVGTVVIERYLQLLGNMVSIFPDATLATPDPEEILREYALTINLPTKLQRSRDASAEILQAQQQKRSMEEAAAQGGALVQGAQQLSQTDLGGGVNALQAMLQ